MEYEIQVSKLWEDLIEEQKNIDVTLGTEIKNIYAQWLWETGQNLVRSPLYGKMETNELIDEFCKRVQKKKRYIQYAVSAYKTFPYTDWKEVQGILNEKYPDRQISERFFLSLLSNQEESKDEGELAPLHRGLRNAIDIDLEELLQKIKDSKEEIYVKIYIGEMQYTYHVNVFDSKEEREDYEREKELELEAEREDYLAEKEPELETEKIEPVYNKETENIMPIEVEGEKGIAVFKKDEIAEHETAKINFWQSAEYETAKRIVFDFWQFRGMEGSPDPKWIAREIHHAKALLKMRLSEFKEGLSEDDIFAILEWRIADPYWATKLTSLGLLRTHLSSWAIEARNTPSNFEAFLDRFPELDYRKIEPVSDEAIYARAEKLKEAVAKARKNGVSISQEVYEKLYRAAKVKFKLFERAR